MASFPGGPGGDSQPLCFDAPEGVPQSNEFKGKHIFVRECYSKYYDDIVKLLNSDDDANDVRMVSVTGTPGIGKSLFYLYFYKRYLHENEGETLLTASFSKTNELEECIIWNPSANQEATPEKIPKEACDLYLYDGPPNMKPLGKTKMVAFTCPNARWFSMTSKYADHQKIFMPGWDLPEIMDANEALKLELTADQLEKRFAVFGGTVRYTLTKNANYVNTGFNAIKTGLSALSSIDHIQQCFEGTASLDMVVHRLMHYQPAMATDAAEGDFDWTPAGLLPGSTLIAIEMSKRLDTKLAREREKLFKWLEGAGKAAPFSAWLFENYAHELLVAGGTFQQRYLQGVDDYTSTPPLVINPTSGNYTRFNLEEKSLDEIFVETYQMPKSASLASADS